MVGVGGGLPVALVPALARGPLPLGLAKRLALGASAPRARGVAEGVLLERGEAALAPVVLTPRAPPVVEAGRVLATRPGTARVVVHVGRRRVASA